MAAELKVCVFVVQEDLAWLERLSNALKPLGIRLDPSDQADVALAVLSPASIASEAFRRDLFGSRFSQTVLPVAPRAMAPGSLPPDWQGRIVYVFDEAKAFDQHAMAVNGLLRRLIASDTVQGQTRIDGPPRRGLETAEPAARRGRTTGETRVLMPSSDRPQPSAGAKLVARPRSRPALTADQMAGLLALRPSSKSFAGGDDHSFEVAQTHAGSRTAIGASGDRLERKKPAGSPYAGAATSMDTAPPAREAAYPASPVALPPPPAPAPAPASASASASTSASEPVTGAPRTYAPKPRAAAPVGYRAASKGGGGGGAAAAMSIFALLAGGAAVYALATDAGRETARHLLALVGVKLNAFSVFGLFRSRKLEPKLPEPAEPPATSKTDLVDCSVFVPPSASPGDSFLVQVFLHVPEHAERAQFAATLMDPSAGLRGVQTLETSINRGARVDVTLSAQGLDIAEPRQSVVWRGEPVFCQFEVTLDADCEGRSFFPVARISVDGGLVGRIAFKIVARSGVVEPKPEPAGDTARRYRYAFLSYASPDRAEVLKRAQVLKAAGVDFFQDVLSLDPGQRWEREIFSHIDRCDLFLLFWSRSAKASVYVLKEAMYALERQNGGDAPDIVPVILDGPPVIEPPQELKDLHFNDTFSYLIAVESSTPRR